MKRYITIDWFRKDYNFNGIDNQEITDEQILYAIGVASSRVDTLTGGMIKKGLRENYYKYTDQGGLILDETKVDANNLAEAKDATECIYEQVAAMAKFAINTGWDFMSGSFSSSLGSQSDSEMLDFETSKDSIEKTALEALRIYDFTTFMFVDSFQIAYDDEDDNYKPGGKITSDQRPLTEAGLVSRLTDPNWTAGTNGIEVVETIPGQPSAGITIKLAQAPDASIPYLTDHYADYADFANKAKDGEIVKYDQMPDGTNTKGVFYYKTPGGIVVFQSKEDNDKIYQAKGDYQAKGNYALSSDLSMDSADIFDMPARPVLTADQNINYNGDRPRK